MNTMQTIQPLTRKRLFENSSSRRKKAQICELHEGLGAIKLRSLTPRFSGVSDSAMDCRTVSTVFRCVETVETVSNGLRSRDTPLKRGVNERRSSDIPIKHKAARQKPSNKKPCYLGCYTGSESPAAAFTLTELLVVIAVLALFAATQLPALTRAKAPAHLAQCMNNLRQMGQATMLYKVENADAYPHGNRISGPGTGTGSVLDPTGWPMQLLRYLGGYQTSVQPNVYLCPSETTVAGGWAFQLHYVANRTLLTDLGDSPGPMIGARVRKPSIYWMFSEKDPQTFCNIRPGGLANPILAAWNYPPGSPGMRRHNGGMNSVAADGHVEWLRMPPYQPGQPPPPNFLELGDCSNGQNPASTWQDNGRRVKLFSRESIQGFGG